jgi:MscS family membrane protein
MLCALLAVAAATAHAQALGGTLASNPAAIGETADLDAMRATALQSFRDRSRRLIDDRVERGSQTPLAELNELLEARIDGLRDAINESIEPLRSDGLLSRSEAARAIGQTSETAWQDFAEAVEAKARGLRAPPRRSDFERSAPFALDMLKYITLERNQTLDYLVFFSAVAAGILVAWACSRLLIRLRTRLEDRNFSVLPSLVNSIRGPLYFTLALAGIAVGLQRFWLPRPTEITLWTGVKLAVIAASLWLVLSLVNLAAQGIGWTLKTTYREPDRQTVSIIRRSLQLGVLAVYAIVVAEIIFGVELQSVLIGVGLLGVAITLAAQDSLKNLFGSLTIVIDRPFRVGDLIKFKGYTGTVQDIGFRSTKIREFDGHLVIIPNAEIITDAVQNIDARPWIRRRFRIGIRYDTPPQKVREAIDIVQNILDARHDTSDDMAPHVAFEGFGDFSLNLLVQYCLEPGDYWDAMEKGSTLHIEILDRFEQAGIGFAFPTQTTVLETDPDRSPTITLPDRPRAGSAGND